MTFREEDGGVVRDLVPIEPLAVSVKHRDRSNLCDVGAAMASRQRLAIAVLR